MSDGREAMMENSSRPGWVIRRAWVAECGNCGAWSPAEETAERAGHSSHMREVDGVAMCLPCAASIEAEGCGTGNPWDDLPSYDR